MNNNTAMFRDDWKIRLWLDCDNNGNLIKIHTCFVFPYNKQNLLKNYKFLKVQCFWYILAYFLRSPSNIININRCILIVSLLSSKTDIDDCASHPCKNNGTCTDQVNGFNCSCAPGFNGVQCETGNYIQNKLVSALDEQI